MIMITLSELQAQVTEWSNRNFPNNKPHHSLLGLVEEHGELHDAESKEDTTDAIADVMIYLADYCGRNGLKLRDVTSPILNGLRWLCHYHLKGEQGIRYKPEEIISHKQIQVDKIAANMKETCRLEGVDFYATITATWTKVKTRDWQKNPIHAAKIVEEQI